MAQSLIRELLGSELAKALAGDVAAISILEAARSALRGRRTTAPSQGQQVSVIPPPPKELHKALLALTKDEIEEVTKLMAGLQHAHKVELSKWALEDLNKLFKLDHEARTQLLTAVTGPTVLDHVNQVKDWFEAQFTSLSPESQAILREWEQWAENLNRP